MKKTTYSGKPVEDLKKLLYSKRVEGRKLRFGATGSRTRDVKALRAIKKDIARIMTEMNKPNNE